MEVYIAFSVRVGWEIQQIDEFESELSSFCVHLCV